MTRAPLDYTVLIPSRLSSSRLPEKPLADIAGLPMVVRVAQRAQLSHASRVVVATDDARIFKVCQDHGIDVLITEKDHPSGSDRLAQCCELLNLADEHIVVNVQGDEPLIEPTLIDQVAGLLVQHDQCPMGTVAHSIDKMEDFLNPNVVKVVLNKHKMAHYFSRSPIPFCRDTPHGPQIEQPDAFLKSIQALRHIGIYAYKSAFLKTFPKLEVSPLERIEALEQLRVLWHGFDIAVHVTHLACHAGVDTQEDLDRIRQFFLTNLLK
jgi:3-deoxy-manno-octulosonate cytidylyltransferase (CMP-KDO synthetase)